MSNFIEKIHRLRIEERVNNFFKRIGVKTLDLYMFKSYLGPFIMTFAIVIFILMMQFLWLYIDELVGKGLSLKVIFQFVGWGACTLLPLALPLATLLASIMTMGNLGENSELLSMRAAGISLPRILRPISYIAIIIVIGSFFAANNLIPIAWNKIYTLREDIGRTKEEIKIPVGIFYDGIDGYIIRVGSRDKNNLMHSIMIYDHTKHNANTDLTVADSGRFSLTEDKQGLVITLHNGINYHEDNKINFQDTSLTLQKVAFKYQQITLPLKNYAFTQSDKSRYGDEVMAKNLSQLKVDRDSLSKEHNNTLNSSTRKSVLGEAIWHSNQLDTSMNKGFKKSIDKSILFKWRSHEDKVNAYKQAVEALGNETNNAKYNDALVYQVAYPLRRAIIESYRKFTISLACLIFFFIGAPIGAIVKKGGLGTPVIISILFFVLYWVIDISGKKLANDGAVSPFVGTFISTFVLAPIGAFLTWKSTKDSTIFDLEIFFKNIKNFFAKIFSKKQRDKLKAQARKESIEIEEENKRWRERETTK